MNRFYSLNNLTVYTLLLMHCCCFSNSSFQLPGFCMPRMLKDDDDGSDSDGGSFEAVTPEHNSEIPEERDANPSMKKHRHILEEVDGELEMEDLAPTCDNEMSSTVLVDIAQTSHDQLLSFVPPLPQDVPPSSPPLPSSPPPVLPPPPSIPHSCAFSDSYSNGASMQVCAILVWISKLSCKRIWI